MNWRKISFTIILILLLGLVGVTQSVHADSDEKELFFVAQKAFDDGFYDVAIRYLDQFLQQYPRSEKQIQAKLLLGQCHFFQNQYLKAYEVFQGLLTYSEFKDATLFWLGETYLKGSDYKEAEKHYKQVMEVYADSIYAPQAYYSLGWTYFLQENFEEAMQQFLKFIRLFPTHQLKEDASFKLGECAFNLNEFETSAKYYQDYLVAFPDSIRAAQVNFYIGESFYYLEDFLVASTYYAKAAEISTDHHLTGLAKINLGWCYLKLKRFELSQKAFEEAKEIVKDQPELIDDVLLGQANLFSEMGDHPKAVEAFTQLIDQFADNPRLTEAYLGRANSLYNLRQYFQAIEAYQSIVDKFQNDPNAKEVVEKAFFGLAWTSLKTNQPEAAITHFEKIVGMTSNNVVKISTLTQIADVYQDTGHFDKAIEIYDGILKEYPDSLYSDYVQFRQGVALLKAEKTEAAVLSLKSLSTNFPKSKYVKDAPYFLGVAAFKKEDWHTSKDYMENYIKTAETSEFSPEAHYLLAFSLLNLNEGKEALKIFESTIQQFPQETAILKNSELGIAKCFYQIGETNQAITKFNEIIGKYPDSSITQEAFLWLGNYYMEASNFEKVVEILEDFLTKFPQSEVTDIAHLSLGQSYEAIDQFEKALNHYKAITNSDDKELYAKAKLAIANIFSRNLDPQTAIKTYEGIISSSPEFKRDAYIKIAELYNNEQNFSKALESYQNALKAEVGLSQITDPEIQFLIADTHETLKDIPKAVEEYLKIPYLYPNERLWNVKSYLRIGRIFEDSEKWGEAKITYQKIIQYQTEESKYAQERIDWIDTHNLAAKQP